jgi:hypothetical protein
MISFTKQLRSGEKWFHFYFIRIRFVDGAKYFVMVPDTTQEFHFIIEKNNGEWKKNETPKVPQWIDDLEKELVDIVIENERLATR